MAYHGLDAATGDLIPKRYDARGVTTRQLAMALGVGMLNIQQHHIGLAQHRVKALRMLGRISIAAAIKARMHTAAGILMHGAKQIGQEIRLQQGLATREVMPPDL